jgi:hypothetical protein
MRIPSRRHRPAKRCHGEAQELNGRACAVIPAEASKSEGDDGNNHALDSARNAAIYARMFDMIRKPRRRIR